VQSIDVEWPSGMKDHVTNVPANQFLVIEEGKGLVTKAPVAVTTSTASDKARSGR